MSCCDGQNCNCAALGSSTVNVTGNGTPTNPWVPSVKLDAAAGNLLTAEPGGLRLDCGDLTGCGLGNVSTDASNILTNGTDGKAYLNCAAVCACGCGGGGSESLATKTTSYIMVAADDVIVGNGTSITITLPDAAGAGVIPGNRYVVKNINATSLTVDAVGGDLIDNSAMMTLGQWESITVVSNGTQWLVI